MAFLNERLHQVRSVGMDQLIAEIEEYKNAPIGAFSSRTVLQFLQAAVGLDDKQKLTRDGVKNLALFSPPLLSLKLGKITDPTVITICMEVAAMSPGSSLEFWMDTQLFSFLNKRLITKLPPPKRVERWSNMKDDRSGFFDK